MKLKKSIGRAARRARRPESRRVAKKMPIRSPFSRGFLSGVVDFSIEIFYNGMRRISKRSFL